VRTGTLFVTAGARGFVDPADGSVRLRNVLAFVDQAAMAQTVGEMVARVLLTVDAVPARLVLAHTAPVPVRMPGDDRWRWERRAVGAPVVDNLLAVAAEIDADLIIAAAKRRLSPFAWWFGSTAERVVRRAQCPVLMLPPI
jgi:nucleotide-binding universal stress UspA family protein